MSKNTCFVVDSSSDTSYTSQAWSKKDLELNPGQTDRQVVASGRKLNLGGDLRWVAKRISKFPRKCAQAAKKTF